jgi:hypothetical protein
MPMISHKQKNYENKLIFCWHLKSQKEQDPDWIRDSAVQHNGFGSVSKQYRSGTLVDSKVDCLLDIYIAKSFDDAVSDVLSKKLMPLVVYYPGKTISNDDF